MYGQANHEYLIFLATEAQRLCVCMRVGVCVCVRAHTCVCVCVGKGEFLKATGGRGEEMQRKTVVCVGEVLTCFFGSCVFLKKKKKSWHPVKSRPDKHVLVIHVRTIISVILVLFLFLKFHETGEKMPPACQEECVSVRPICTQIKPHSD